MSSLQEPGSRILALPQEASGEESYSAPWLVSFTDLIALMLAFFVLLYSTMRIEEESWYKLTESLLPNFDPLALVEQPSLPETATIEREDIAFGRDLDYLASLLSTQIAALPSLGQTVVQRLDDRIVVSLPGTLLFETGQAALTPAAQAALAGLVQVLRSHSNRMLIVGHADPRVSSAGGEMQNWKLSLERAQALAAALKNQGYPGEISRAGQGAEHYAFLDPRLSQVRRLDLARRADIHLLAARGGE